MEKLLPEIRFPEFSDEWTIKRLGDLIFEKSETANSNHPIQPYNSKWSNSKA